MSSPLKSPGGRSKIDTIESSSSDDLQVREIRLLPKKVLSKNPATHLDAPSDAESHTQPLRTSSKRRRMFVSIDSSDEQEKISVGKRLSSPPVDESLYVDEYSPSRRGKSHVQPLRTSKRRRTFVSSDSSDEQEEISVEERPSSPPADESLSMDEYSPARRGRRLIHRRKIDKHQLVSDEAEDLAGEVEEERM
jgi:hypothetical protein